MEKTHNLEVPGSSPGWSTLTIKELRKPRNSLFLLAFDYFTIQTLRMIPWNVGDHSG